MSATADEYSMSLDFTPVKSLMLYYEAGRKDYHYGGYITITFLGMKCPAHLR